ncbi:MAG: Uma2 family endonuclease [Candidatus Viridilinea halotolerans]|uniref:Uma2 family endonuclease n=1 Tax=Candidatus Viridilinea halotolerans TaxID=2491704 RepID=A0A426U7W2_9CHLR|nr:MAG: Uma2 family endonuclease [Candidatus Viridilinea halotolerans]
MYMTMSTKTNFNDDEHYTSEDYGLNELVEGGLAPLRPASDEHGAYELNVALALRMFADAHGLGKVRTGDVGIMTKREPTTVLTADVVFISNKRYAQKSGKGFLPFAPDLVVEVVTPEYSRAALSQKLAAYFAIEVRLVWVLDAESRTVFAYTATNEVQTFGPDDTLTGEPVLPGLRVAVASLFEV